MSLKIFTVVILGYVSAFLMGMSLGGALATELLSKVNAGVNITKFSWLTIHMPAGWLWWLAFVIIGTILVVRYVRPF